MKKNLLLSTLVVVLLFACKPERLVSPAEPVKALSGAWSISKATRNGTDITTRFDFSQFRIHFTDSSYTIDSLVPFVVSKNGTWAFDDPVYPFNIRFTVTDSVGKTITLQYPIVSGERNMVISFSPGCSSNSYQYTLQKAN